MAESFHEEASIRINWKESIKIAIKFAFFIKIVYSYSISDCTGA